MASYQIRQRDPLLDQGVQAMLERRARELFGMGLIVVAAIFALMLMSYSPDDPGWMVATDAPAANILGRVGAAIASTLITISGLGAWGIPTVIFAWGIRFSTHRGGERAMSRVVFAVIAVALGSVYCATLVPPADWSHSFGLGGLFGDTILGSLINIAPGGAAIGLKLVSLVVAVAFLAMMLFVTGFDSAELLRIGRFLVLGLVVAYTGTLMLLSRSASGSVSAVQAWNDHRIQKRHAAHEAAAAAPAEPPRPAATRRRETYIAAAPMTEADDDGYGHPAAMQPLRNAAARSLRADPRYAEPLAEAAQYVAPKEKLSLLARLPQLMRREIEPEHELIEPALSAQASQAHMPSEDRIRARISTAIKQRTAEPVDTMSPLAAAIARREPPVVSRPRGPAPLVANTRPAAPQQSAHLPAEPPLRGPSPRAPMVEIEDEDDADWQPDFTPRTPLIADRRGPAVPIVQPPAVKKPAPSRQALA
ncbi:MAG: DNA translocase FtsK 4TM domain-containing protein, partial [bacterium]